MALTEIPSELSSTPSIVDNGNATAITIDASRNLLVGTTTTNIATEGTVIYGLGNEGVMTLSSTNMTALYVNRSTDGELVQFRQGGSTVAGSIGGGTTFLTIGSGTGNVYFQNGVMAPTASSSGASSNGVVDIGTASSRFKDLYLSGGAYLGGTAAANKLDYYEEVAWTPTQAGVTLSVTKARALRVGNLVTLNARIIWPSNNDSTTVALGGLPFPAQGTWEGTASIMAAYAVLDSTRPQLNSYMGGSSINFYKSGSGVTWAALTNAALSGADIIFTVSYLAS